MDCRLGLDHQCTLPKAQRTAELQVQVQQRGQLDEPVVVQRIEEPPGYLLKDGYRRYLIARQLGWTSVHVRIEPGLVGTVSPPA